MPTQSTNIPLSYVPLGGDAFRLAINVGINGGLQQSYLFDTGSSVLNAVYNPATWNGFGGTTAVPASTIPNGNNIQYCYGGSTINNCRGYIGNIVQVPSLSFDNPAGGTTTFTAPATAGFQINAVFADNSVGQNPPLVFPGYFCNSPHSCPSNPNMAAPDGPQFYGIFGAGDFASLQGGCSVALALPATCPSGSYTPPVVVGGVLGQVAVSGSGFTQGYVVAANGQPNPANTGGGKNPPIGTAVVVIGGAPTKVSLCNPCVTVGLTPQLIGQFAPVGLPSQNPTRAGLVPWARTEAINFPNPYGTTPGNNSSTEFGAMFTVALTPSGGAPPAATSLSLLDSGTVNFNLSDSLSGAIPGATSISITGKTPDGKPIQGEYKFVDEFPMSEGFEENAEFFTLTYESPIAVSHHIAFACIAPMLWLRAGSRGRRIEKFPAKGWEVADAYGLLIELDCATDFLKAAGKAKALRVAYIVTDDERRFQALARRLPEGVEAIRLYESYLTNFSFSNED